MCFPEQPSCRACRARCSANTLSDATLSIQHIPHNKIGSSLSFVISITCRNGGQEPSDNSQRLRDEFPLFSRSLHDPEDNVGNTNTRTSLLAQNVQTLARELSPAHRERTGLHPRPQISRIQTRFRGLQAEPNLTHASLESLDSSVSLPLSTAPSIARDMPQGTLICILPRIAYREQHEKDFDRSLEYVQVQCKILKHLDTYDAAITPRQAYKWTAHIVPRSQQPQPVQALRLCYYMRSLCFDVFADIKPSRDPQSDIDDTMLRLFIANRHSERRGLSYDHLYWVQRIRTGEVIPKAYKLQRSGTSSRESRPQLRLDLGPVLNSNTMNETSDHRADGVVQMRGGEAADHPRYGTAKQKLEKRRAGQRELQRELITLRTQWVLDQASQYFAAETSRFLAMHIGPEERPTNSSLVSRHHHVSPGDILSTYGPGNTTTEEGGEWMVTDVAIFWPETTRLRNHCHLFVGTAKIERSRRHSM